jgi:L-amino acid N-acyltransferase YncA
VACVRFQYRMPLRAWRPTASASRPQRSVGKSTSRSLLHHRVGGGRELYTQLLRRLTERGYRQAFAVITQPNEASNSFHRSFGFQDAGLYRRAAWKHDCWHYVAWMQLDPLDTADPDEPPGPTG